jgi:hypothetical protein
MSLIGIIASQNYPRTFTVDYLVVAGWWWWWRLK